MTPAERAFDGEPCAHIAARDQHLRLRRIERMQRQATFRHRIHAYTGAIA